MLYHLVSRTWAQGGRTGVPRFDYYLRKVFPEIVSVNPQTSPRFDEDDVVIADNHLALGVPDCVPCIVVHHGCAPYHYRVDPVWQNRETLRMSEDQKAVLSRPRTIFVAPSAWVASVFREIAPPTYPERTFFIPHWVPEIPVACGREDALKVRRPIVIGDWRTENKGSAIWPILARAIPKFEFRVLEYDPDSEEARHRAYQSADVYLCLSLSEGCPYSVLDAEAARIPIVTTLTGCALDVPACILQDRNDVEEIRRCLDAALDFSPRPRLYTFEMWAGAWRQVLGKILR